MRRDPVPRSLNRRSSFYACGQQSTSGPAVCSLESCCQMEIAVMIPNPIDSFGCWSEAEKRGQWGCHA